MRELVFVPGLGADERLFDVYKDQFHYKVLDCSLKGAVSLNEYVVSLIGQIESNNPVLVGVSFGGLLAQEIKLRLPKSKVILISSFTSSKELPNILQLVPMQLLISFAGVIHPNVPKFGLRYAFGIKNEFETNLLMAIMKDTPVSYLKFALQILLKWKGTGVSIDYRIHGNKDVLVPIKEVEPDLKLTGGHFVIYQCPKEIGNAIKDFLITIDKY